MERDFYRAVRAAMDIAEAQTASDWERDKMTYTIPSWGQAESGGFVQGINTEINYISWERSKNTQVYATRRGEKDTNGAFLAIDRTDPNNVIGHCWGAKTRLDTDVNTEIPTGTEIAWDMSESALPRTGSHALLRLRGTGGRCVH